MMLLNLAVVALIVVLGVALLYRDRIAHGISASSGVLFVVLAVIALTALFVPSLYRSAASFSLEQIGVLAQVRQLDDRLVLNDVADVSGDLLGQVKSFLGQATPTPPEASPQPTRLIEQNLFPGLVSIVAAMFRLSALVLSVSGMVALVALNFAASLYGDRRRLQSELAALEERVAGLESDRAVPAAVAPDGEPPSSEPPALLPRT